MRPLPRTLALAVVALLGLGFGPCGEIGFGTPFFFFRAPLYQQLSLTGELAVELRLPLGADVADLTLFVNGEVADTSGFTQAGGFATGTIPDPGPGRHWLLAKVPFAGFFPLHFSWRAATEVELVALDDPDACEVLNAAECLLPFPSSRFLTDADTPTTYQVSYPAEGMPPISGGNDLLAFLGGARFPIDPAPYAQNDGFSPTAQLLVHFPGGVDLAASGAARLLEATRNFDLRSLDDDHVSVLLDVDTGERVAHFLENDARAGGAFADRQVTFLRPAESLLPGHRYIVAFRRLVAPGGAPVEPEPVFAALRDGRPSTIDAVNARRDAMEEIFARLEDAGVDRSDLVIAWDFVVGSDASLTGAMLSMRDQAFDWVAAQDPADLFQVTVDEVVTQPADCDANSIWKIVEGTFQVPLFLETRPTSGDPAPADPIATPDTLGYLRLDAEGTPVAEGTTSPPFAVALPCSVLDGVPAAPLVFGHGLFGSGPGTVRDIGGAIADALASMKQSGVLPGDVAFDYATGGTNWSGLSSLEVPPLPDSLPSDLGEILNDPVLLAQVVELLQSFIGQLFLNFDRFEALPDRLRQGQLHQLVLGRLMKSGVLVTHPAFQLADGTPTIAADDEMYYFGASLGGIMGIMFAALSPDIERANVDVPSINFSLLLQRAKPFRALQQFLDIVETDPMIQVLGLQLLHELWVRGESAGYAHHVTGATLPPLDGSGSGKNVLMTVALYDQQVATLGAQISAATLRLPNLVGSVLTDLPLVPDVSGPLLGAHVVYDTGSYVLGEDDPFIPPLANLFAPVDDNECDPHGLRGFIPASLRQLTTFLRPGGEIENFCNGLCDAAEPLELPGGLDMPCDPND